MKNWIKIALMLALAFFASMGLEAQQGETPIRVGDKLSLSLGGVTLPDEASALSSIPFTVSNQGTIRLPHLDGEISAQGVTPTELGRRLEAAYKSAGIYTNPRINVARVMDATTSQVVSIIGEVKQGGGTVVYRPGLTLLDAIGEKGGFSDFADVKRVKLIRGNRTTVHNLKDVGGDPRVNVALQPDDRIIIPQSKPFGGLLGN